MKVVSLMLGKFIAEKARSCQAQNCKIFMSWQTTDNYERMQPSERKNSRNRPTPLKIAWGLGELLSEK